MQGFILSDSQTGSSAAMPSRAMSQKARRSSTGMAGGGLMALGSAGQFSLSTAAPHPVPQPSALRIPAGGSAAASAAPAGFLSASQHSVSTAIASSAPMHPTAVVDGPPPPASPTIRRASETLSSKGSFDNVGALSGSLSPPRRVVSADGGGGGGSADSSWGGSGNVSSSGPPPPPPPVSAPPPSSHFVVPPQAPPQAKMTVSRVVAGLLSAPKTWSEKVSGKKGIHCPIAIIKPTTCPTPRMPVPIRCPISNKPALLCPPITLSDTKRHGLIYHQQHLCLYLRSKPSRLSPLCSNPPRTPQTTAVGTRAPSSAGTWNVWRRSLSNASKTHTTRYRMTEYTWCNYTRMHERMR